MDARNTQTAARRADHFAFENYDRTGELTLQRLEALLAINAETARQKATFRTEQEKLEAELMKNPIPLNKVFPYFGLMLGTFPPAAIFARFFMESENFRYEDAWIFGILIVVNLVTAVIGYFSGKLIAKMVSKVENLSWLTMIFLLPPIGILWGIMAGGAGGIIILIFGAVFGALLGAAVGSAALPLFTIFHRLLKKGESIEYKHFLPLSLGITFTICAFILGL